MFTMFTMLSIFPASLRAGLCAFPSFAWTNPSGAFAAECLADPALLVAVVAVVTSTCGLLRIAVNLLEIELQSPAGDDGDLSSTTVLAPPGLVAGLSSDTLTYIVTVS